MFKNISVLFCLFALPLISVAEVTNIDNAGLQNLINEGVPVIDIRRSEEWQQTGIVANSHLITFFDNKGNYDIKAWTAKLDEILAQDREKPFVLICRTGNRTARISQYLNAKLGYSRVYNVRAGIVEWIKQENPVVAPMLEASKPTPLLPK